MNVYAGESVNLPIPNKNSTLYVKKDKCNFPLMSVENLRKDIQ